MLKKSPGKKFHSLHSLNKAFPYTIQQIQLKKKCKNCKKLTGDGPQRMKRFEKIINYLKTMYIFINSPLYLKYILFEEIKLLFKLCPAYQQTNLI